MKYEVYSTDSNFNFQVRFFVEEIITTESNEQIVKIAYESYEQYRIEQGDTVETVTQRVANRAQELKVKFDLLKAIHLEVKGEV